MDISNNQSSGNDNVTPNTQSSTSNTKTSNPPTPISSLRAKTDPAWAHVAYKKEETQNVYTCLFCGNSYRGGGINRMKQHLAGITGQISSCKKASHDVRHRMIESLKECSKKKVIENIEEEIEDIHVDSPIIMSSTKKRKSIGSMDNYFAPRTTPDSQPGIKSALATKEVKHNVKMLIVEWAIVNCIPFKAFDCPLFQRAIDGIASIGPGFKAPSAYDFKTNLLSDWRKECQLLIAKWKNNGCTLMTDGWTNVRQRTLINFLVYSIHGMVFVKSVDASNLVKDAKTLFTLFYEVIEWIGPKNIVHVVTDNAANYVACGRLIKEKYKNSYWSPYAAHCLNLILKDFSSMPNVSDLASKASKVTIFAYNHMVFLSWLRRRPSWKEIVRPGAIRFATTFITLHSIYMHKNDLQALVVDKHFVDHRLSKIEARKNFSVIILDNRFWNNCYQVVKIVSPLIKLLRIVNSNEKPSLPYVYEGMRRAKIAIKEMFKKNKELYKPYTRIIQTRWDRHLKTNLHAVSYLLNPAVTYGPDCPSKSKLMMALIDVVESYSNEDIDGFLVMKQATTYREGKESFSKPSCQKAAQKLDPYEWWTYYGCSVLELQRVAMRILSQTSTSSGCERNWSLFERIHTKRRNRLEHKRLNDLVFTNYNLRLKHRSTLKKSKSYDPIDYENIDMVDFWVAEEDPTLEFDDRDVDTLESILNNDSTANSTTLESANEGDEDMNIADPPPLQDDVVAPAFPCPAVDISAHANDLSDDFDFP
ncbi:uncharacterized protein LOC114753361 [Neltuma alba]|uniref:uncharacterized protein LOC114753361 n=1 Tax=Neltuma alba TaxID=207710 RepID=UPI0010A43F72|nr:uncharacterized protein LOC114753361 [Prosopis alba]